VSRNAAGEPLRYLGTLVDITERRLAEQALIETHEQLAATLNALPDLLFEVDADGRIYDFRAPAPQLLFTTPDVFLGKTMADLLPLEVGHVVQQALAEARSTGRHRGATYPLEVPAELCWFELSIAAKGDSHASPPRFLMLVRDITERRRTEAERDRLQAQLTQAQKMEAVGQLAGGVAHDFNNILAAIMLEVGALTHEPGLGLRIKDALEGVQLEAQRAANLTRQLLIFSRRSVIQTTAIDLNALVEDFLRLLRRLLGERVEVRFQATQPFPTVEADGGMLEQVLLNLCVNARDAMPDGGCIAIRTAVLELDEPAAKARPHARPGRFAELSVMDAGCGMDAATRDHIFEPFFTTKPPGKGTGLGLSTVYGIVAQHNGWIEVESEVNRGTTFRVLLPLSTLAPLPALNHTPPPALTGHETVLLVEDERNLRRTAAQGLRLSGYRVLEAGDGPEALAIWRQHHPEISAVLTDLVLPGGMSGLDLAVEVRKQKPDVSLIISSGYSPEYSTLAGDPPERVLYLPKPYTVDQLWKLVRTSLDQSRPPQAGAESSARP
jgi:two-component system, cell cycle sensor histidine kinase and response regulator CckA